MAQWEEPRFVDNNVADFGVQDSETQDGKSESFFGKIKTKAKNKSNLLKTKLKGSKGSKTGTEGDNAEETNPNVNSSSEDEFQPDAQETSERQFPSTVDENPGEKKTFDYSGDEENVGANTGYLRQPYESELKATESPRKFAAGDLPESGWQETEGDENVTDLSRKFENLGRNPEEEETNYTTNVGLGNYPSNKADAGSQDWDTAETTAPDQIEQKKGQGWGAAAYENVVKAKETVANKVQGVPDSATETDRSEGNNWEAPADETDQSNGRSWGEGDEAGETAPTEGQSWGDSAYDSVIKAKQTIASNIPGATPVPVEETDKTLDTYTQDSEGENAAAVAPKSYTQSATDTLYGVKDRVLGTLKPSEEVKSPANTNSTQGDNSSYAQKATAAIYGLKDTVGEKINSFSDKTSDVTATTTREKKTYTQTASDALFGAKKVMVEKTSPREHDKALADKMTETITNLPTTLKESMFGSAATPTTTTTAVTTCAADQSGEATPQSPGLVSRFTSLFAAAPKKAAEDTSPEYVEETTST